MEVVLDRPHESALQHNVTCVRQHTSQHALKAIHLLHVVAQVGKGQLVLGGVDIVDESPVLDIKPYVPFCDGVAGAEAPAWVQVSGASGGGGYGVTCLHRHAGALQLAAAMP